MSNSLIFEIDGEDDNIVSEIIAVLNFYADKKSWVSISTGFALQYDPVPRPIDVDHGEKARNLLVKLTVDY